MIELGRTALIFVHLFFFSFALSSMLYADYLVLKGRIDTAGYRRWTRKVLLLLLVFLVTGFAIVFIDTGFKFSVIASNPKLSLKLLCIAVLCLNGFLLHQLSFHLHCKEGRLSRRAALFLGLVGAGSICHWLMAAFIGSTAALADYSIATVVPGYLGVCFIACILGALLTPYLQNRVNMNRAQAELVQLGLRKQPASV